MTLPPQSPLISSTNFWPKPVDPRGFGATTTQPCAAQSDGFQRADQPSSHAPCGPPWMRKTTGYFFAGSNAGGFTSQYWTRAPAGARRREALGRREGDVLPPRAVFVGAEPSPVDVAAPGVSR